MARKTLIQIRRGAEAALGTLAEGELGFCTDSGKLYIGSVSGNVLLFSRNTVSGDMLKSVYDTNNNGKVDYAQTADTVAWTGVDGKPAAFPPSEHTHTVLTPLADNYKDGLALPSQYDRGITVFFSNNPANKFNGVSYGTVTTIKGYSNMASVQYLYPYNADAPISYRYALYDKDLWLPWRSLATRESVLPSGGVTWNQLRGG